MTCAATLPTGIPKLSPVNVFVAPGAERRRASISADTREDSPKRFENAHVALRAVRLRMSSHERVAGTLLVIEGMYPERIAASAVTGGAIAVLYFRGELAAVRALVAGLAIGRGADVPSHMTSLVHTVAAVARDGLVGASEWEHPGVRSVSKLRRDEPEPLVTFQALLRSLELSVVNVRVTALAGVLPSPIVT